MKSGHNNKIDEKVRQEMETAEQLNNMVMDVLMKCFIPTEYEILRANPICWRVIKRKSTTTVVAVVLEDLNNGTYAFTVGDWPYRPTTEDTSRESLIEILQRLFPL